MRLEELIDRDYSVVGKGRYLRTLEHDSLVIDTEQQVFFWNSRGIIGDAYKWLIDIKGVSREEANDILKDTGFYFPVRNVLRAEKPAVVVHAGLVEAFYTAGKKHREYWHDVRGYTDKTIDQFRLGYSGSEWYTIPIFVEGSFRNFQCRRHEPKGMKPWYQGLGTLPFNFSMLAVTPWVVLTEGPVDAIMLRQMDIPSASQTTGAGSIDIYRKLYSQFTNVDRIYICYDNDDAGNKGAKALGNLFGEKARIYNLWDFEDGYDITDYFKQGNSRTNLLTLFEEKGKGAWQIF